MTSPAIPTVRDLRRRLRRLRRAHSERTLGDLMTDVYIIGFVVVLYGGSASVALRRHLAQRFGGPVGFEATRGWLMVAVLVVLAAVAWRGLRALGPLLTTPAALSWCLATPIDRSAWLRTPLRWELAISAVLGAITGTFAGWAGFGTAGLTWAPAIGAAVGVALTGAAVAAQSRDRAQRRRLVVADAVLAVGVALIGLALAARLADVRTGPPRLPGAAWLGLALVAAAGMVWLAVRSVPRIDRAALTGGAQLAASGLTAVVMLDPTLLTVLVEARRWSRARRVHSRHFVRSRRAWALFQADILRQARRPAGLFAWAALILAPYAVAAFVPAAAAPARIVAGYLAAERLSAGLRLVARSASLRRMLGGSNGALKTVHLAVPALGLVAWWALTQWSVPTATPPALTVLLVAGLLGAVYRTATRPPMSYDVGLAYTPMGSVPVPLLRRLLRGPDLVAILVLIDLLV